MNTQKPCPMTTDGAITILERIAHTESKWPGTEDTLEALDMAIKALYRAKPVNELQIENAQLRAVITENDPNFFRRKCRVCGCDWNHPCNDHDFWVEDNLCSACAHKLKIGSDQSRDETDSSL